MINNAFVKLERKKNGEIDKAFSDTSRHSSDLVYIKGSGENRVWKSYLTPHGKDETEAIKQAVGDLLRRTQEVESNTTIGRILGDRQQIQRITNTLMGEGRVINIRTEVYLATVHQAEAYIANPYGQFTFLNPDTGMLENITEGIRREMPRFIEQGLAACAWQAPIVEKIYCSKLMYGVDNQAAIFSKDGVRFMSLLEFSVPGIINWFDIVKRNPTVKAAHIFRTDKGFDEPQIIPHVSPKNSVSVSMVTPTDALAMLGVEVDNIPYDSFTSGPLLMIFFALCFHEIFPNEKIIPGLLASNRQSPYVATYSDDGGLPNLERVYNEDTFDSSRLKSNQSVVYSSPLAMYLESWAPEQAQSIIEKFGGLRL
jgi:hypothetical protein